MTSSSKTRLTDWRKTSAWHRRRSPWTRSTLGRRCWSWWTGGASCCWWWQQSCIMTNNSSWWRWWSSQSMWRQRAPRRSKSKQWWLFGRLGFSPSVTWPGYLRLTELLLKVNKRSFCDYSGLHLRRDKCQKLKSLRKCRTTWFASQKAKIASMRKRWQAWGKNYCHS